MNVLDFRKYTIKTTEKHKVADNQTGRQTDRHINKARRLQAAVEQRSVVT